MRAAIAGLLFVCVGPLSAATLVEYRFEPSADTTIFAEVAGQPSGWDDVSDGQGGSLWLSTTAGGVVRRSLVRFDLGGLPAGAQVVSAQLSLYESRARDTHAVRMHRVLAPWGEGASNGGGQGEGDQAEQGDATWRWRDYLVAEWDQRGGDFMPTASAVATVGAPNQSYTWGSTAGLVDDITGWLAAPDTNHGWIFIGSEADTQSAKRFDSGESPFAVQRPMLVVQVSVVPEPAAAALLASGLVLVSLVARTRRRG